MCLPSRKNPGTMIAKEGAGLFLRGEETRVHGSRKIFVGSMLAATVLVAGLTELYISSTPIADTEQPVIQSNEYSAEWYLSKLRKSIRNSRFYHRIVFVLPFRIQLQNKFLIMKSYIKVMERIFPIASTASREKKQKMHHKSEKTALCQSGLFFLVTDPNVQ